MLIDVSEEESVTQPLFMAFTLLQIITLTTAKCNTPRALRPKYLFIP